MWYFSIARHLHAHIEKMVPALTLLDSAAAAIGPEHRRQSSAVTAVQKELLIGRVVDPGSAGDSGRNPTSTGGYTWYGVSNNKDTTLKGNIASVYPVQAWYSLFDTLVAAGSHMFSTANFQVPKKALMFSLSHGTFLESIGMYQS